MAFEEMSFEDLQSKKIQLNKDSELNKTLFSEGRFDRGLISGGIQSTLGNFSSVLNTKQNLKNYEFNAEMQGANYLKNQGKLSAYEQEVLEQASLKRTQVQSEFTKVKGQFLAHNANSGVTGRSVQSRYNNLSLKEDLTIGEINAQTDSELSNIYRSGDEITDNYLSTLNQLDLDYKSKQPGYFETIATNATNFAGGFTSGGGKITDLFGGINNEDIDLNKDKKTDKLFSSFDNSNLTII